MEHIIKETLPDGKFKLTPEEGYMIQDKRTGRKHSVVITDAPKYFIAVER